MDPDQDPANLRTRVLGAAALADRAGVTDVQVVAHAAAATRSQQSLAIAAQLSKGFADVVEPTAHGIGMDIKDSSPAPSWYLPCFRNVQTVMHNLGHVYLAQSQEPWPAGADAVVASANETLDHLVGLLQQVVPDGRPMTPGAVVDPEQACRYIGELSVTR